VVGANPFMARGWYQLAVASRNAGDPATGLRAYARYLEIGGAPPSERTVFGADSPAEVAYAIASMHAVASRPDSAVAWLQRALALGLRNRARIATDSSFASLRADARVLGMMGPARATSREAGWRADVTFLREEVRRVHAARKLPLNDAFEAAAETLLADIPTLTENQFVVRVQGALARVGNGHTTFIPEGLAGWNRTIPLQYETFGDSLYIVAADSAYADIVGARVLRIGGQPVARALVTLDAISSRDNPATVLRNRARNLRFPQILNGLGLAASDSAVSLTLRTVRGIEREVTVRARPTPADYHRFAGASSWVWADAGSTAPQPLARRDLRSSYWFTYLPDSRTVYFAFNSVVNDRAETLAAFGGRLLAFVDSTRAERLVVDLRANNGGDSRLLLPLTDGIAASRVNRPGRLYLLVGRYTYSAGMNAATLLERHTAATVVGEPTPSSPNFVGESNVFSLPNSGIPVSISDVYWQSSWPFDDRVWIAPQLYVPPTFDAFRTRRDPALEAVLQARVPATVLH
jgi:lysozyme family protein